MKKIKKLYQERKKRVEAAICLEIPDRVPVTSMVYTFAARYAGISIQDYIFKPSKNFQAHKIFNREFGPDMNYMPATDMHPLMLALAQPCPIKVPGIQLSPFESWQSFEQEIMKVKDYDFLIKKGFHQFMFKLLYKIRPEYLHTGKMSALRNILRFNRHVVQAAIISGISILDAKKAGFPTFIGGGFESPLSMLSLARSYKEFIFDVYRRPDKVIKAINKALPMLLGSAIFMAKATESRRVNIGLHRESLFSPQHFEKIALPQIKKIVRVLTRSGIIPVLHCDSDWTPHLHYLKEISENRCVVEFDSATDIFKAKKVLGNSMCIKGDVPAKLLALGTKTQVMDYCRRLIDEVGDGGGFILASGCEIPIDAKPENVHVMRESVEKYGWY